MNDNQLISMLINNTDLEKVAELEVEPIVAQREEVSKEQVQRVPTLVDSSSESKPDVAAPVIKLSDYEYNVPAGNSLMLEDCNIPNYRLAKCCANCTFSIYDPVKHSARCVKWDCCIVPVYYCDEHTDPKSLIDSSEGEYESYSEKPEQSEKLVGDVETELLDSVAEKSAEVELESVNSAEVTSEVTSEVISEVVEQRLDLVEGGYEDNELYQQVLTNAPSFEPEVYKQAYIKKKYAQLYKEKYANTVSR